MTLAITPRESMLLTDLRQATSNVFTG